MAFVVDDVDVAPGAVRTGRATVVTAPDTEPRVERSSRFEDPNGIIVQFVQWV